MDWVAWSENLPTLDIRWLVSAGNQTTYSVTLPLSPYPTDRWRKGEVIESKYDFRLPITLPDATYQLQFQLIDPATGQPIVHTPTVLSGIHVASRARAFTPPGSIGRQLGVQFGDLATLLGADVSPSSAQPGQSIKTALYWQARSITATSYTVFIHVLGPDGQPVIQVDNWQIGRDSPTSTWLPNQVIADPYTLTLPADAPAGEYQVWVGLYNAADGQRLPAIDSRGNHLPQDRAALGSAFLVTR